MVMRGVIGVCLLGGLTSGAFALENGPIDARVTDAATHESVSGAIVIATWDRVNSSIAASWETCNHVEVVVTDAQGRYHIDPWSRFFYNPFAGRFWITVWAYRAGMTAPLPPAVRFDERTGDIQMAEFTGSHSERMAALWRFSVFSCAGADESLKILRPFREAVYAEAQAIATDSAEDRRTLAAIWRQVHERERTIVTAPDPPAGVAPTLKTISPPVAPSQSLPQTPTAPPR
jgi:hypothetical protein